MTRVMISCGEASGDLYAGARIRALVDRGHETVLLELVEVVLRRPHVQRELPRDLPEVQPGRPGDELVRAPTALEFEGVPDHPGPLGLEGGDVEREQGDRVERRHGDPHVVQAGEREQRRQPGDRLPAARKPHSPLPGRER